MNMTTVRLTSAMFVLGLLAASCGSDNAAVEPAPDPVTVTQAAPEPEPEPEPKDTGPTSMLTGAAVSHDVLGRPAVIVKVENSPQARPQSGLELADIVYEEVVEGGVTRFFSVFQTHLPDSVGPVRSARPVDIDLMGTYGNALFAYSGARSEVQQMLAATRATRITEGFPGFVRDRQRRAPHNLYLNVAAALEAASDRPLAPPPDLGWQFDETVPSGAVTCPPVGVATTTPCLDPGAAITIRMARGGYVTDWEYDAANGVYRRAQNGDVFPVTGQGRIGAANVVVLATRHYVGVSGYPETDGTTSLAPAIILRDGRRYEATWRKPVANEPLELLDLAGGAFRLKPGPTWIHLPPANLLPEVWG